MNRIPQPLVTVCVPSIGSSPYLDETLASVKAAWIDDMELVLLDNAAPLPMTHEILERHGLSGRIVRIEERVQIAQSWNTAIRAARGTWLHLLHDDDWIEPDLYLALQRDVKSNESLGVWFCSTFNEFVSSATSPDYVTRVEGGVVRDTSVMGRMIFDENHTRCVGTVINNDVARRVGGFDETMKHNLDVECFWRCACDSGAFFQSMPLGHYRIHTGSLTQHQGQRRKQAIIEDGRLFNDTVRILEKYTGEKTGDVAPRRHAARVLSGICRYHLHRLQFARAYSAWMLARKHGVGIGN